MLQVTKTTLFHNYYFPGIVVKTKGIYFYSLTTLMRNFFVQLPLLRHAVSFITPKTLPLNIMSKIFFERLRTIDELIRRKATGNPETLARKLRISKSTMYSYISIMREMGAPINYCRLRCCYYYENDEEFVLRFNGAKTCS
jgi:hypothetical protein